MRLVNYILPEIGHCSVGQSVHCWHKKPLVNRKPEVELTKRARRSNARQDGRTESEAGFKR